uniref:Multifunctional protein surE (Stationary-phase survival protein surE) Includes 5'/3'-nucleotidase (Nucleoside monophosphate phosphohydrolase) Exopolyphosphatase n=1 Tax=mine drainage metagenome TaxID=410659 RepID=E6PDU4_9ZZZZ
MRMPTILLTNDDGIGSPGLKALARALAEIARIVVVAPDGNRSGVSHAITTGDSVGIAPYHGIDGVRAYACTGTPADCAVIGIGELCEGRPDLVVSGINDGPNLADDVNYSGTVAGAVEAVLLGVRALAVSLASDPDDPSMPRRWESAAEQARLIIPLALAELPPERYWNVNVPNLAPEELLGFRFTNLGRKRYGDTIARTDERRDARYFRVWNLPGRSDSEDPDCDIGAVLRGYVSITPIAIDRTDRAELNRLRLAPVPGV